MEIQSLSFVCLISKIDTELQEIKGGQRYVNRLYSRSINGNTTQNIRTYHATDGFSFTDYWSESISYEWLNI